MPEEIEESKVGGIKLLSEVDFSGPRGDTPTTVWEKRYYNLKREYENYRRIYGEPWV